MTEQNIKDLQEMITLCTYAKKIKKYCQNNTNCDECCFYREDKCVIGYFAIEEQEWDDDGHTEYTEIVHECTPKEWKI